MKSVKKNRELILSVTKKDLKIQTFRSGGKGGQHQNTTDSGVRIIHPDSGAVGESREERSQAQNKKKAFRRMVEHPKFKIWMSEKTIEYDTKKTLEKRVEEAMAPKNIKIEVRENNVWVERDVL